MLRTLTLAVLSSLVSLSCANDQIDSEGGLDFSANEQKLLPCYQVPPYAWTYQYKGNVRIDYAINCGSLSFLTGIDSDDAESSIVGAADNINNLMGGNKLTRVGCTNETDLGILDWQCPDGYKGLVTVVDPNVAYFDHRVDLTLRAVA